MKILLISDDIEIMKQSKRILRQDVIMHAVSFNDFVKCIQFNYDFYIICFNAFKVRCKDFKIILDLKCKTGKPILALLENGNTTDQFEVLAMGAMEYLEYPVEDEVYKEKLKQFYRWIWYLKRKTETE